jgi:hypothetical protein
MVGDYQERLVVYEMQKKVQVSLKSSVNTMKSLVGDLVKFGDRDQMIRASCQRYHSPRIDYLCLYRTPQLTVKIYNIKGHDPLPLVAPHDHRYNFQTFVLKGMVHNVVCREFATNNPAHCNKHLFHFRTQFLGGQAQFHYQRPVELCWDYQEILREGESYSLEVPEIHTIVVPNEDTTLLLVQHSDQPVEYTRLYMESDQPPSLKGLYVPYMMEEFAKELKELV